MTNKKYIWSVVLLLVACSSSGVVGDDERPRILITNDDGYSTEGIAALAEEFSVFADVVVVAPLENQSGASQSIRSISIKSGVRVVPVGIGDRLHGHAVSGSPTDSVYIGVTLFGKDQPFDMVVSGINHGPNYGTAYLYSGTVGAAFQAAVHGLPAIAISQSLRRGEFKTAAVFAAKLARSLLDNPLPIGIIVSVNVPAGDINGAVAVPPGESPLTIDLRPFENDAGETVYEAKIVKRTDVVTTQDVRAYEDGFIAVTTLKLDRSHFESLWELAGRDFIGVPQK